MNLIDRQQALALGRGLRLDWEPQKACHVLLYAGASSSSMPVPAGSWRCWTATVPWQRSSTAWHNASRCTGARGGRTGVSGGGPRQILDRMTGSPALVWLLSWWDALRWRLSSRTIRTGLPMSQSFSPFASSYRLKSSLVPAAGNNVANYAKPSVRARYWWSATLA